MKSLPHYVFRAYDIRGVADTDVTEELCELVGRGFGSELRERYQKEHPTVIVGRDARVSGPRLEKALIDGLISSGCYVQIIGETPSPVNYFALCHFDGDGSIQVTASHNDKEDNGLKLQVQRAEAFAGDDLQMLMKRIEEERFVDGEGSAEEIDAITPYKEKIKSLIRHTERSPATPFDSGLHSQTSAQDDVAGCSRSTSPLQSLKIVADFGNGVSGPIYGSILRELGVDLIPLYEEPDGTFPNHIADPINQDTLTDLIAKVKEESADCGIAFDGDGDRVGCVDENGNIISADYLLLLLAEDHLKGNAGATVIYTVSMSGILESEIPKMGGRAEMCVVGHSFVEHAMREHNSHLGAEQSGHFFCGEEYYDYDDALVAAVRILSIFATNQPINQSTFSSLFSNYPKVYQNPEWRPHCPDDKKADVIAAVTKHFQDAGYPCITIDGVRVDFGDGAWAGVRMSNTSPKLSICLEARSEEKLKEIDGIVREHLKDYPEVENT